MRMSQATEVWLKSMRSDGRINSPRTERNYRFTLLKHAEDVDNRDPRLTNRDDVRRTLSRWANPNTKALHLWALRSFYDFMVEDGHGDGKDNGRRKDNPARQVRAPRTKKPQVYRLTVDEVVALRMSVRGQRERRVIDLAILAGLRADELRGLQGRHFRRPGWIWVSADIAKGGQFRWVPVPAELEPVWAEIADTVGDDDHAIPMVRHVFDGKTPEGFPRRRTEVHPGTPISYQSLWDLVRRVGKRAGIRAPIHPHLLRHAYGSAVARHAQDIRVAQFVLGHASVQTTQHYAGGLSLDDVALALDGFGLPRTQGSAVADGATVQALLPEPLSSDFSRVLRGLFENPAIRRAARDMANA